MNRLGVWIEGGGGDVGDRGSRYLYIYVEVQKTQSSTLTGIS